MVWIAENPKYDEEDRKLLRYLSKRIGEKDSTKIVNVFSLYKYLKNHDIKSAKEIETIAYYDNKKNHPVFSPSQSRKIASLMKQSGGAGDEAIVLDKAIRGMLTLIQEYIPQPIVIATNNAYSWITLLKSIEETPGIGPFVDIGKEAFVQATKTFAVGANGIASGVGGPVGSAAVAIPSAIAVSFACITYLLDDELGEALLASFLAVPFIGPTLYKAAGSLGKFGRKLYQHKDAIVGTTRTFLGDNIGNNVESIIPNMELKNGAKRFSTRRHRGHKWRRTRSERH
jgi:hypothetical protein